MHAKFNPGSNRLVCAEFLFNSGSIIHQTKSLALKLDTMRCDDEGKR